MARLIDANKINYDLKCIQECEDDEAVIEMAVTKDEIDALPTIDAVPVKTIIDEAFKAYNEVRTNTVYGPDAAIINFACKLLNINADELLDDFDEEKEDIGK